ncbi:MAG: putative regulator of Ras-like GTPase activity (Roadblock/LC7/MglB family) [Verrucomicrobiales bacterium]|jgi:predicted regulator of Ras-like GTPase activity (Roadblock/LC7/MglB family)
MSADSSRDSEMTDATSVGDLPVDVVEILKDLCHRADLLSVALLHETGVVLEQVGEDRFRDQGEIGALTAGAFHATAMLGNRLGDANVEGLCHEGRYQSFLIVPVDTERLLLAVFPSGCKLGVVRLCLQRSAGALRGEKCVEKDSQRQSVAETGDWLGA